MFGKKIGEIQNGVFGLDLLFAVMLLFVLGDKWSQRAKIVPIALGLFASIWKLNLIQLFSLDML